MSAFEERSYGQLSLAVHARGQQTRIPLNGTIELSNRCPLACLHCYNNLPIGDSEARLGELTTDEHRRIIDEMVEAGCLWLLLTGGEILARKDFLEIYTHAKKRGLLVTLFTNGTMITPEIADHLVRFRPFAIEITLYGRTRETYERLTQVPGSYDRCMRGIALLMERGLPLKLKTVAVNVNRHEIWDMKRFAEEELGVEFKFDGMINARIDCSSSPLGTRLRAEDLVALDMEDAPRRGEWARLVRDHTGPPRKGIGDVYHCGGGLSAFAIDPQGKMSICVLSHADTFDLRKGSFREGWEQFLLKVRGKKVTRQASKCASCHIRALCSTCAATAELENGDPETPVSFFCEVAHLRAQALGFVPPAHGDCEYCEGGAAHESLLQKVGPLRQIASGSHHPAARRPMVFLPQIVAAKSPPSADCGSGGCGSCSTTANTDEAA